MEEKLIEELKQDKIRLFVVGLLVFLAAASIYQSYQIRILQYDIIYLKQTVSSIEKQSPQSNTLSLQQIMGEIIPKGVPDYGEKAGVSYDDPENSLRTLVSYHFSISLSDEEFKRYVKIATTPDTACEYCCGVGNLGFGREDGNLNCGCSHNIAFSGLTKWLIKNTNYTDEQIIQEIRKWKILFFPREALAEELQRRGMSPEAFGLPAMVGGC